MQLEDQVPKVKQLGEVLLDAGLITETSLVAALAKQVGLEFIDLTDFRIDGSAAALIPETVAKRYVALPIAFDNEKLVVAMSDPSNVYAIDDIRTMTGKDIKPVVATRTDILAAISRVQRMEGSIESLAAGAEEAAGDDEFDLGKTKELVEEAPIVKLVNLLITQAVNDRASDIHIEPEEKDLRIRYRIDGVLHEVMRSPKTIQAGVISRLKIMSEMDIAERRVPQDGRVGLVVGGKAIDLRVASLPTVYGEKIVLRILDKSSVMLKLEDLGFLDVNFQRFQSVFTKPYG